MLQGSLEDFTLDEVLGLLSSTTKSGRLRLSGNRGTGSLWLHDGQLTAAEASKIPGKTGIEDVMFEMLRFEDGTFSFMADETPTDANAPEQVDFIVELAQDRLTEWRTIEGIVPSLRHMVGLAEDLPSKDLLISNDEWKTVLAVGEDSAVEPVCDRLGLDEVDGSRRIMQMIERGLLTIADPSDAAAEMPSVLSSVIAPVNPVSTSTVEEVASEVPSALASAETARPPMPAPPSPAEIDSFSSELDASSPFATGELLDDSLVGAEDDGGSVLMRYLQSDS